MTGDEVSARLAAVSALRALCLRLPHVATPTEIERLKRFDALVAAPERATEQDVEALVAGWSRWWREGRTAERVPRRRPIREATAGGGHAPALLATDPASDEPARPELR